MEELLTKYIRNECNLVEQQWVMDWLQNPANEPYLRKLMRKQWNQPVRPDGPEPDWQQMWLKIRQKTEERITPLEPSLSRTIWQQIWHTAIWVGCIVAVGLGVLFVRKSQLPNDAVYRSGFDKPMKIELADRSVVILNRNSKLVVSADWSGPIRNVWLEGEALFLIEEQPKDYQFSIHTANQLVEQDRKATLYVSQRGPKDRTIVERGNTAMQSALQEMLLKQVEVPEEAQTDSPFTRLEFNPLKKFFSHRSN